MLTGFRQVFLRYRWLKLLVAVLLSTPAMSLAAQSLEIKLIDGRNGRAVIGTSAYVNVWVGSARKEAIAIATDSSGIARLLLTRNSNEVNVHDSAARGTIVAGHPIVQYDESFRINVPYVLCEAGDHSPLELKSFVTKEVLDHGFASGNTCGKVTASPLPGQVVLFVRALSFLEKMKQ